MMRLTKLIPVRSASRMTNIGAVAAVSFAVVSAGSGVFGVPQDIHANTIERSDTFLIKRLGAIVHNAGIEEVLRKHKIALFFILLWISDGMRTLTYDLLSLPPSSRSNRRT